METFSALLAICAGNSPVSGEFPAQRPVTRSFDIFFDLRKDPLMVAIHFERRFDASMKYVINSQEYPIGKVKDFFYRVEFQIRVIYYCSCNYLVTTYFFWIENIPQDISCDTRDVLVQYIDSVIKTDIPDESDVELCQLVKRLQTHSHSKYFQKTPPSSGRFKFPFVLQII